MYDGSSATLIESDSMAIEVTTADGRKFVIPEDEAEDPPVWVDCGYATEWMWRNRVKWNAEYARRRECAERINSNSRRRPSARPDVAHYGRTMVRRVKDMKMTSNWANWPKMCWAMKLRRAIPVG